ncbi:AAA family ATPase [Pseudomonas sp. PGPPP1]|uniref:AAA family ATPase n=1 Tax=Pseudomonas sp. PGPPP1 TaxID=2015553 RepID=UPI00257DD29C|nr:AAA family ATPase [Pseudomonas sp. PGPPP1]
MKSIRLKGFRSLSDTGRIEIKPITLLLGQNSSGKSTFLRSLALLKQGTSVRTREPFLWVGELVDFGGITETLSTFSDEKRLSFCYDFDLPSELQLLRNSHIRKSISSRSNVSVEISEVAAPIKNDATFEYKIQIEKDNLEFVISKDGSISLLNINGKEYTALVAHIAVKHWKGPIPTFARKESDDAFKVLEGDDGSDFNMALQKFVATRLHGRTGEQKRDNLIHRLSYFPLAALNASKSGYIGDTVWRKHAASWSKTSPDFVELKNLLIGTKFFDYINMIADYTLEVLEKSKYITPLRASAERYYRKQGLAVDELDAQGRNFALFLDNMSQTDQTGFSRWAQDFFGISIAVEENGGHLSVYLTSKEVGAGKVNIADTGFGFSQIFPILAQLWVAQRAGSRKARVSIPIFFSIEQPELHLHPRLQANLADVLVNSINAAKVANIDLRLVIETHSEYLVNRLGYLIAKNKFSNEDASILIFDRESYSLPTQLTHATFNEKGFLENWPYGFFEPVAI